MKKYKPTNIFTVKSATPITPKIFNQPETIAVQKQQTPGEIWAEIIHEVAKEDEENEKNKYLKVRKLEKTEPNLHVKSNFTISGLKPENK